MITDEEIAQGWNAAIEKYEMRLKHQDEGKAISLVAEWNGSIAGYIKEPLNKSARADRVMILRQNKAQKRGNTVCIASFCNEIMAQNHSQTPQTHLFRGS